MRYVKKPIEVEAVQIRWSTWNDVCDFLGIIVNEKNPGFYGNASDACGEQPPYINLTIPTLHGPVQAQHGDWLVRGPQGDFYPVKPDTFQLLYEPVAEAAGTDR